MKIELKKKRSKPVSTGLGRRRVIGAGEHRDEVLERRREDKLVGDQAEHEAAKTLAALKRQSAA